jgi:hypothetical protein
LKIPKCVIILDEDVPDEAHGQLSVGFKGIDRANETESPWF